MTIIITPAKEPRGNVREQLRLSICLATITMMMMINSSSSGSTAGSNSIPSFAIPIIAVIAFILVLALLWYRRRQLILEHQLNAGNVDTWIASQDGEVVISVVNDKELKIEDSYNPAFDVSKLPVQKQAEAQAKIEAAVLETTSSKMTEMSATVRNSLIRKSVSLKSGDMTVDAADESSSERLSIYTNNPLKDRSPVSPVVRQSVSRSLPSLASPSPVSLASENL